MSENIKKVLIVTKINDGKSAALGINISDWLKDRGVETYICEHPNSSQRLKVDDIAEGLSFVLVLGGDGTFISTAGSVINYGIPVLGINHGRVGFLAEAMPEEWETVLTKFMANDLDISERITLHYKIIRDSKLFYEGVAVNDLVLSRGEVARIISLDMDYCNKSIKNLRADGLIVSTPTGSTAYNVSAGGPLVQPELSVVCVTPVCPFLNGIRPMVLMAENELTISVTESSGDIFLTEDGRIPLPLKCGDKMVVKRHSKDLKLARICKNTFFEKLRSKGFLTE